MAAQATTPRPTTRSSPPPPLAPDPGSPRAVEPARAAGAGGSSRPLGRAAPACPDRGAQPPKRATRNGIPAVRTRTPRKAAVLSGRNPSWQDMCRGSSGSALHRPPLPPRSAYGEGTLSPGQWPAHARAIETSRMIPGNDPCMILTLTRRQDARATLALRAGTGPGRRQVGAWQPDRAKRLMPFCAGPSRLQPLRPVTTMAPCGRDPGSRGSGSG